MNDELILFVGRDVISFTFSIYDRWGNRVFDKSDYVPDPAGSDGWDGSFGGRRLDPGVFVYFARALFLDGKIIEYSGFLCVFHLKDPGPMLAGAA